MPHAVLANSGGIDSRVSAAMLVAGGWTLHSVYLDWTHLPGNADAAAETASRYCASHEVIPWPNGWAPYNQRTSHPSLPWISHVAGAITVSRAAVLNAEAIASGVRNEGSTDWADGFRAWFGTHKYRPCPDVLLPVWDMSTAAITAKGKALGVNLDSTWSCTGSDPQCGTCASCRRRVTQGIALAVAVPA